MIFSVFQKIWVFGCGIGATIRIGREMLCVPYAGFLESIKDSKKCNDLNSAVDEITLVPTSTAGAPFEVTLTNTILK